MGCVMKEVRATTNMHYNDVIMNAMVSQIISLVTVYLIVNSGADQRKHQSSASLAFQREIHRWLVNSPHKGPVTRKMFPFNDVIMWFSQLKLILSSIEQTNVLQQVPLLSGSGETDCNANVIWTLLSSLAALATSGAVSDENFVKMTFSFPCIDWNFQRNQMCVDVDQIIGKFTVSSTISSYQQQRNHEGMHYWPCEDFRHAWYCEYGRQIITRE